MASHTDDQLEAWIERSSLGTSAARQLRERTPSVQADFVDLHNRVVHSGGNTAQNRRGVDPLVKAAIAGDPTAKERLHTTIRPLVVHYCRARIPTLEFSDVAQEVCLAVVAALPNYRDQDLPFLAFVYSIATQKVADWHRFAARDRFEPILEVPEMDGDPEQRAIQGELSDQMVQLLHILPPKQREVLLLRVVVGLSAAETAEAVGSTPEAVRATQYRALARLRKHLVAQDPADF